MKSSLFAFMLLPTLLSGCVQRMAEQGGVRAFDLKPRVQPAETISWHSLQTDASVRPVHFTQSMLRRGRERFDIYCSACHGFIGYGDGMIVQRGFLAPPSYHQARLRNAPDQHFFDVMTQGYGAMYSYRDKLSPADRWAVVAYIRALQLSQNTQVSSLPEPLPMELSP